jgi:hypothetical protein
MEDGGTGEGNVTLSINRGPDDLAGEVSDWAVAEILIWDRHLDSEEMLTIDRQLRSKVTGRVPTSYRHKCNVNDVNAVCNNTVGSYTCLCGVGYENSDADGTITCVDVDECALNCLVSAKLPNAPYISEGLSPHRRSSTALIVVLLRVSLLPSN